MLRLPICAALVAVPSASAAVGAKPLRCASADLRYPFRPGMPRDFGVWRLKVTAGTCATAHRVAATWQRRFEHSPPARLPRSVRGFRFRALAPDAAQTYRLRGTRRRTTVRFGYVVPNG